MSHAEGYHRLSSGFISLSTDPSLFYFSARHVSHILRYVIYSTNNCLRIEFTYHRAVHILTWEIFSDRIILLWICSVLIYGKSALSFSRPALFLPFFTVLAFLTRSIKNYVHRCISVALLYVNWVQITSCLLPYLSPLFHCRILL